MTGLRERQKHDRRRSILDSADELFRKRGYLSTTIQEIAESANVSHATVHNYYASKTGILIVLIAEETEDLLLILEEIISERHKNAEDSICHYLETVVERSMSHFGDEVWKFVHASLITNFDSDAAREFRDLRAQLQSGLSRLNVRLLEEGLLPKQCDPDLLADLFYQMHYVTFVNLVSDQSMTMDDYRARLRQTIGHVISLFNSRSGAGK